MFKRGILYLTHICFGFFILLPQYNLNAQNNFSYNKFLESANHIPEDSLPYFLYQKSEDFLNADSLYAAKELLSHSIEYALEIPDTSLIGKCNLRQGKVFNELLEFNHSFIAFNKAFRISKQLHDTDMMLKAMSGIENYYYQIELIDSATSYCTKAIHINKIKKNYVSLSDNYRALDSYQIAYMDNGNGHSFLFDGLMDSSLNAAYKAKSPHYLVFALANYGSELFTRGDSALGLKYLQSAIDSARNLPTPSNALVYSLTKSSALNLLSGEIGKASTLLNEALPMAVKLKDTRQLTHIYYLLGNIQSNNDSINKALTSYYKAITLAEKYRYKYYLPMIYKRLFNLFLISELYDSSFVYQKKYMDVFKKENNNEMKYEIARLSAKFQIEEKVEAIDDLTIISNQRKTIISNQKRFLALMGFGIIVIGLLFSLLYFQYRKIKKSHLKLSQNAIELNQKRKEIAELRKKKDQQREDVYNGLKTKLEDLFENRKIYLKKDLTMSKTAHSLKTNTSYLSALIHKQYNCKFNQFVNKYRVEKSCELLSNQKMNIYSIEGIADMAGFQSKSVFNRVFKEATGIHPSAFRKATAEAD